MSAKVKMNKTEQGAVILKQALMEKKKMSVQEIMDVLGVNRQSVYNYLRILEENGIRLASEKCGHSVIYSLADGASDVNSYEAMDLNVLRSFVIVRKLQKAPMEPKKLFKALNVRQTGYNEYEDQGTDIGRTQFDKLLRTLLEKGVLSQEKKRAVLFPSGHLVPILLELSEDEYWELCDQLETIAPGYPYYKELRGIYEKLCRMGAEFADVDDSIYHIYGRKYSQLEKIRSSMNRLSLEKCISDIVRIKYISQSSRRTQQTYLAAGLIVYSADKDKVYIIGKDAQASGKVKKSFRIMRLDTILEIEKTEHPNPCWFTSDFRNIYDAMYSISSESTKEKIVVEFDNVANVRYKLESLLCQRKNAKLETNDKKIIYTDYVIGLQDVEAFLRQFGRSCHIVEPPKLREMMKASVEKSLEAYKAYALEVENGNKL